jgi:hypothetical protein
MKVSPRVDYPVRVLAQEWDEEPVRADLYRGLFAVTLNHVVEIVFVPDISEVAPPWDGGTLPADLDDVDTPAQARLASALLGRYVVTPNDAYAGDTATFRWPSEADRPGTVWYVGSAEFARFAADLRQLSSVVGGRFTDTTVLDLRSYAVIRFIEGLVGTPWFDPGDAAILGREAGGPPASGERGG